MYREGSFALTVWKETQRVVKITFSVTKYHIKEERRNARLVDTILMILYMSW